MQKEWVKNRDQIEVTKLRGDALDIMNAAYSAIDTAEIIKKNVLLEKGVLSISGHEYQLRDYKNVYVVGTGKASALAASALEGILGNIIKDGVIIDREVIKCSHIKVFKGSHPKPSTDNLEAAKELVSIADKATKDDLVIALITGGGSSLMCWPESECEQSGKLYDASIQHYWTIYELNTVRKHISGIKGGGLAKILYPAQVIGLIFCDIPGNDLSAVASGPTFLDTTTERDAMEILKKAGIQKEFELHETPKDGRYFKRVVNIPLVTSANATSAMVARAAQLGYEPFFIAKPMLMFAEDAIEEMRGHSGSGKAVIAGGEVKIKWPKGLSGRKGHGGRNEHMSLLALKEINENQLFLSLASDGMDNSDSAGAIADFLTLKKAKEHKLKITEYAKNMNTHIFFEVTGDLVFTGPTQANVSDLMLLLSRK